jgi:hypothetical protein
MAGEHRQRIGRGQAAQFAALQLRAPGQVRNIRKGPLRARVQNALRGFLGQAAHHGKTQPHHRHV